MKSPMLYFNADAKILDLMKKGDEEALVMLYEANKRMVRSYILKNSGTNDDADDLLQEVIVIVWERVRTGRFEHSAKLSTFIYATVQNMWRRRLARLKRETPTEFSEMNTLDDTTSPIDLLIEDEISKKISAALVQLGEPCKTLLLLFYWEECSMDDIARKMKFANAETAKSKKYQCKKALEEILIAMGIQ